MLVRTTGILMPPNKARKSELRLCFPNRSELVFDDATDQDLAFPCVPSARLMNGGLPDARVLIEHFIRDAVKHDRAVIQPLQVVNLVFTLFCDCARR